MITQKQLYKIPGQTSGKMRMYFIGTLAQKDMVPTNHWEVDTGDLWFNITDSSLYGYYNSEWHIIAGGLGIIPRIATTLEAATANDVISCSIDIGPDISDLVTNGGFDADSDWTKNGGAAIADGKANFSLTGQLKQTISLVAGQQYQTIITVSDYVSGQFLLNIGGTNGTSRVADGTYTEIIEAGSGSELRLQGLSSDLSVDNVSVKEISLISVACEIEGGTALNTAYPRLSAGTRMLVYLDGSTWRSADIFFDASVAAGEVTPHATTHEAGGADAVDLSDQFYTQTELGNTSTPGGASLIGVFDTADNFTATDVEAALAEIAADIGSHNHDDRYFTETEHLNTSAGAGDAGKPVKLDAGGKIDATMLNRFQPRVSSAATGDITPDMDNYDQYCRTALVATTTINAPTGSTIADGRKLIIRLEAAGAQTLSWDAAYVACQDALPTVTVAGKKVYCGFIYNASDSVWDLVALSQEA